MRSISGFIEIPKIELFTRLANRATEGGLKAYLDAAKARADGDLVACSRLRQSAENMLDTARRAQDEIAAL